MLVSAAGAACVTLRPPDHTQPLKPPYRVTLEVSNGQCRLRPTGAIARHGGVTATRPGWSTQRRPRLACAADWYPLGARGSQGWAWLGQAQRQGPTRWQRE